MKKTAIVAALAASLFATAANAGSIKVEAENQYTGNVDRQTVKLEAWEGIGGAFGIGAEVKTYLAEAGKPAFTDLVGKVGYALPTVAGFTPVVKGEVGVTAGTANKDFWGVSGELQRKVTDKVTVGAGYRYRENFSGSAAANEAKRAHATVSYDLNKNFVVGASYYNYAVPGDNVGSVALSLTKKF